MNNSWYNHRHCRSPWWWR